MKRSDAWRIGGVLLIVVATGLGFWTQQNNEDVHHLLAEQACTLAEANRAQIYRILITLSQVPQVPQEARDALALQASNVIREWTCEEIQGIPPLRNAVTGER